MNTTDPQHSVTVQSFIHSPTSCTPTARLRSGPYPAAPTAVNPPYLLGQIGSSSPFEASICKTPPGTASSTRQDLTSPREMGGWSGPQTQAQTGDNTQPAPGTSSPPFWSWGTGQMQWRLSSLPVDAPAHPPSGTPDTVGCEPCLDQRLQNHAHLLHMLHTGVTVNDNIIQEGGSLCTVCPPTWSI